MFTSKRYTHEFGVVDGTSMGCSGLGKLTRPVVPRELAIAINFSRSGLAKLQKTSAKADQIAIYDWCGACC